MSSGAVSSSSAAPQGGGSSGGGGVGSGAVGSGESGGGSSGGSGDAAASNVQERDAKCPTPDKWGGADLSDNGEGSGGAGSNATKRPIPAQWAEMNKRQRKNWKLRHLKRGSGRDSSPSM